MARNDEPKVEGEATVAEAADGQSEIYRFDRHACNAGHLPFDAKRHARVDRVKLRFKETHGASPMGMGRRSPTRRSSCASKSASINPWRIF